MFPNSHCLSSYISCNSNMCQRSHSLIDRTTSGTLTEGNKLKTISLVFLCNDGFLWWERVVCETSMLSNGGRKCFSAALQLLVTPIKFMELFNHFRHQICATFDISPNKSATCTKRCPWKTYVLQMAKWCPSLSLSLSLFFSRVNVLELWNIREKMCAAFPYPFVRYSRFSLFCHVRHINDLLSYRIISPLFQHANSEHSLFHFTSPFRPFRCAIHFARFCLFISMEKCVNNSVFIAIVV